MEEIYCNCGEIDLTIDNWGERIHTELVTLNSKITEQNMLIKSHLEVMQVFIGLFIAAVVALIFSKVVFKHD